MKNLSIKITAMCFMAIIACPCVTADEKFDLDMVKIPGKNFEMLRTEVTQELYESVMGENPSWFCRDNQVMMITVTKERIKKLKRKTSNYPVEGVSWYDAIFFCNKLSEKEGLQPVYAVNGETCVRKWDYMPGFFNKIYGEITQNIFASGYRLPTVEEWQYAARGGQMYRYSGSDNLGSVGWYHDNSGRVTHPVAQKRPNDYGLYDMSGNVSEWCWDSHGNDYRYSCGGCWNFYDDDCEVDSRGYVSADDKYDGMGFRLVRSTK